MSTEDVLHGLAISQVMLNFAADHGVDSDTCLAGTGITSGMLRDPDALATREQEMRLIENLMLAMPDVPALGFELGLRYTVSTFGTWGFALRTSHNLRDAIERAIRFIGLSTAYCRISSQVIGDSYLIRADPSNIPVQLRQFLLERDCGTAINLMRELKLTGSPVKRLEFVGPPWSYCDRIEELSGLPIHFRCDSNAIVMALDDVMVPLPTFDEHLVRLLEDQCRQLLERRQVGGVAGQVRQRLLGRQGLTATLEDVATALSMSPRSLRRRLEEEATSFRTLVEEARQQLADQLLTGTDMKLDEMALQLGYADTASFTRAFRRWRGISPGQFRTKGLT